MDTISNEIISRCQQGDKLAFRDVVQCYQRMIYSLAFRLLCDEEEAKDIVQETLIRVWTKFRSFDPEQNLRTWIYTIATRLCLDRLKQLEHLELMSDEEECFMDYVSELEADRPLENSELIYVIRTLVSQLSPKQRMVFTLIHLQNLSPPEVEKVTGMDADKIKSNLYVARKTIREKLTKMGFAPEGD